MAAKGSIFSPILVASAVFTSEKLVAYPHCTLASKSAPVTFVAQTDNASACLSHCSGPWILYFGASDHLYFGFFIVLLPLLLLYPWLL